MLLSIQQVFINRVTAHLDGVACPPNICVVSQLTSAKKKYRWWFWWWFRRLIPSKGWVQIQSLSTRLLFFSFAPATKTAPVNPLRFQELRKKKVPCVSVNQLPLWESPLLNTALVFQQPQLNLVPVQKPASAAWTCTDQSRPFSTDADGHTPTREISRAAIVTFHRMTE